MNAPTEFTVNDLGVELGGRRVLHRVAFTVRRGEFLGVIGPNGGGKTTLLRTLLGLVAPAEGGIVWSTGARETGYVPQRCAPDPTYPLRTREVVAQGARGLLPEWGKRRAQTAAGVDKMLARTGLTAQAGTPFVHLSGGQQRRALLARALMREPSMLLLDEPTAGVDTEGQEQICVILRALSDEGTTVVLVSHDVPMVTAHADRIACLAVTLHWHGAADALEPGTVQLAYRCELEKYQVLARRHAHKLELPLGPEKISP